MFPPFSRRPRLRVFGCDVKNGGAAGRPLPKNTFAGLSDVRASQVEVVELLSESRFAFNLALDLKIHPETNDENQKSKL